MSELPNGWVDIAIGEISDVIAGGTPKANDASNFALPGKGIAWLTPADLSGYKQKEISKGSRDLSQKGYDSCSAKLMPKGSLLFSSRAPIGYVALAANEISTNQGFKSFVFPAEVDPTYAFFFLKSIRELADSLGTGTTFKELSGTTTKTLPFRLAPTNEQIRIAQKLDELLAQVDTLKARIDTIPALLKRFRQSVLAAAVSGQLTEEWRASAITLGSAHQLHQQLKESHEAEGGHARGNASNPTEEAHDLSPSDLPECWDIAEMRDICAPGRPITYGILKPGPELEEGVPYIRVADFPGNKLNPANIKKTSPEIDLQFKRARLITGDLLLSIRGSVGRLIKIPEALEGANITQDTARLSISPLVSTTFIYWVLLADSTQRRMKNATRGVAVRGINIGDVRAIQIPLPTLEEQTEVVRRVEQLFAFADQVEAKVASAKTRIDHLTQSILAKAFRGELVPQDPNDEPASVLLERIKAERAAAPKANRGRKASA
ncbi:restriction endonuclease subunit S [Pseudomonas sp. GL-R-19]|uniref:restriction endonuclease subunit S n=1 Tax=Pseudomonas sp. GL-R-19 TaxID=2832391 RepID=UPI001CBA951A|nr:restriction endonuclease subunit S [Pseudomonas sp. GL-R-19]